MNLTPQELKVYEYIKRHPRCTTRDIQRDTWISCPSARITALRHKGVPIKNVGQIKYPNARPFEQYLIDEKVEQLTLV